MSQTFITCPGSSSLGIKLPWLVVVVKTPRVRYWGLEVIIEDSEGEIRRFFAATFQSETRVDKDLCVMPLRLENSWNRVRLNLSELCRRAFGASYVCTLRVRIYADCYLRRVYFAENDPVDDRELPAEFRLFLPVV